MSVRSGVGVPPTTATKLQYHLRKAQISLLPQATISRTLCVHITCVPLRLDNKKPFCACFVYSRIAKGLYLLVLLFCMLLVYLVDDAEHHVQSESHRFCGETLGHVVVGVIIMAHDGILSGESDGFYA